MSGTALDADAQPHDVVVDEARVIDLLGDTSGGYLDASEISAAARALARGDRAPLLRMAAETDFPLFVDQGDPRYYSDGDFLATFCTDGVFPWDTSAPEATRRAQYDAAVAGSAALDVRAVQRRRRGSARSQAPGDGLRRLAAAEPRAAGDPAGAVLPGRARARADRRPRRLGAERERPRRRAPLPARAVRERRQHRPRRPRSTPTAPAT